MLKKIRRRMGSSLVVERNTLSLIETCLLPIEGVRGRRMLLVGVTHAGPQRALKKK
jgi:hypothetical protein